MDCGCVQPDAGALLLRDGEEAGGLDGVGKEDGRRNANEECQDTFDDEDPLRYTSVIGTKMNMDIAYPPAFKPTRGTNSIQPARQKATECTG